MENNFWNKLDQPFFCMAPMEDVTDIAFRQMFAKYSSNFVTYTEFISADGLALAPEEGKKQLLSKLRFEENERPIVAQIFSAKPENIEKAARMVADLGFDGVDINMGCPDKSVEKQGAGSALIKTPELAREIIRAAKKGVGKESNHLIPVSIKTRIGYNDVSLEWIDTVLAEEPAALTVHLRTRKELSDYPAHWELMPEILKLRNKISPETLIIGNGDVKSLEDAKEKVEKYGLPAGQVGCDGVMIGRGLFGKPSFFNSEAGLHCSEEDRLKMLLEHIELFNKYLLKPKFKGYHVMKKHFKAYIGGWCGAKELRIKLMDTNTLQEAQEIIKDYLV